MKRNDTLKIIAMLTMLIDHIGVLIFPNLRILRTIGRIAFPIFAYMIAKGYRHTSNRKKYQIRLLIFGLISQVPYIFLNHDMTANFFHFNVILFFLYSTFVLYVLEQMLEGKWKTTFIIPLLIMIVLPQFLENTYSEFAFSYSTYGILMIIIFYMLDNRWVLVTISYILLSFFSTYQTGATYLSTYSMQWVGYNLTYFQALGEWNIVVDNITGYKDGLVKLDGYFFQARSLMALPFIFFGRQINLVSLNRYVGYAFYPGHITLLILIRLLIGGSIA